AHVGHNAGGGPLLVGDQAIGDGIGVHAKSQLVYDLPAGAKRFTAKGGVDKGGTDQNDGKATSVRFLVIVEK
ncbi:MAG: NPCBM/NEW2 domain-containing protein, partial [Planctomycetes bacterium]|nr:NPCBM/NEW2 domain-containing protein [Planctomycetota bacterium]